MSIKLVVFDLDNTLWDGIWMYDHENVDIKESTRVVIKGLDGRGILQSICSKNDDADGIMDFLEKQHLREYFLYSQISGQPKSVSLNMIKNSFGLSRWDEIAFVDDEPFEREEVRCQYPEVLIFGDGIIPNMLNMPEFSPEVLTDTDKRRRELYKARIQVGKEAQAYSGDYQQFLRELHMKLTIDLMGEQDINRVHQLMVRTNRWNSAVDVWSVDQLSDSLANEGHKKVWCCSLQDRLVNYGVVGFKIVNLSCAIDIVENMALSCRVAGRAIGSAFVAHTMKGAKANKRNVVGVFGETKQNKKLHDLYMFLGFERIRQKGDEFTYFWSSVWNAPLYPDWINVIENA